MERHVLLSGEGRQKTPLSGGRHGVACANGRVLQLPEPNGVLAQLVERCLCKADVRGSNPLDSTSLTAGELIAGGAGVHSPDGVEMLGGYATSEASVPAEYTAWLW